MKPINIAGITYIKLCKIMTLIIPVLESPTILMNDENFDLLKKNSRKKCTVPAVKKLSKKAINFIVDFEEIDDS